MMIITAAENGNGGLSRKPKILSKKNKNKDAL